MRPISSKETTRDNWNHKDKDEIDIVVINELEKTVMIDDVKRNHDRYDENNFIGKAQRLNKKMNI